jgi:hypothetical protein
MPEQITILSSRRAYEFRPDDLRLTTLSIKPVQEEIQQLFHFQSSVMGTPMQTFGEVPVTYPPGFVFSMGVFFSAEKQPVPIRFLHFEQRRIVIEVAGPSSFIDTIAQRLFHFLSQIQIVDGSPVIGEPERILNYSEISAQFSFPLDALFASPVRRVFAKAISENAKGKEVVLAPTLVLPAYTSGQEFASVINYSFSFTLAGRAGTRPEDHIYFSSAPLDSESHLTYLEELERSLTS